MKCSYISCGIEMKELLTVIDNGKERLILCSNDLLAFGLGLIKEEELIIHKSEVDADLFCEICGKPGILYDDGQAQFILCKDTVERLIKRNLKPNEWKVLYEKAGDIYILHDDFYTEDGVALQPAE